MAKTTTRPQAAFRKQFEVGQKPTRAIATDIRQIPLDQLELRPFNVCKVAAYA